jgi:hypothetical protein
MRIKINNTKLNLSIDIIMFIVMMIIAGIGFMIKYVLVPGFKRNEIYGKDVELYFWGLDRHQWGTIHLILSFTFLFLLLFHIILHWTMIKCIYRKLIPKDTARTSLTASFIVLSAVFVIGPLFIKPEISTVVSHYYRRNEHRKYNEELHRKDSLKYKHLFSEQGRTDTVQVIIPILKKTQSENYTNGLHKKHQLYDIEVYGSMTLKETAKKYNIPVSALAASINVPIEFANERLGRLRKQYGFHMNDLRKYIHSNTD